MTSATTDLYEKGAALGRLWADSLAFDDQLDRLANLRDNIVASWPDAWRECFPDRGTYLWHTADGCLTGAEVVAMYAATDAEEIEKTIAKPFWTIATGSYGKLHENGGFVRGFVDAALEARDH